MILKESIHADNLQNQNQGNFKSKWLKLFPNTSHKPLGMPSKRSKPYSKITIDQKQKNKDLIKKTIGKTIMKSMNKFYKHLANLKNNQ